LTEGVSDSETCASVQGDSQKRVMGLEPTTFTLATCTTTQANAGNSQDLQHEAPAVTGLVQETRGGTRPTDPHLLAVVTAWPGLAEPIKAGIVAMIKAATVSAIAPEG
jgi:hypothetical protein